MCCRQQGARGAVREHFIPALAGCMAGPECMAGAAHLLLLLGAALAYLCQHVAPSLAANGVPACTPQSTHPPNRRTMHTTATSTCTTRASAA